MTFYTACPECKSTNIVEHQDEDLWVESCGGCGITLSDTWIGDDDSDHVGPTEFPLCLPTGVEVQYVESIPLQSLELRSGESFTFPVRTITLTES